MGRTVCCVSLIGEVADIERDWIWLRDWLPLALGEKEVHWMIQTTATSLPDTNPDVAIFLGDPPFHPQQNFKHSFGIWVQTPRPAAAAAAALPIVKRNHPSTAVQIYLEQPQQASTSLAMLEMTVTAGYRFLLMARANGIKNLSQGVTLSVDAPADYVHSPEVTLWMRQEPVLTELIQRLEKTMQPNMDQLRSLYGLAMRNRHEWSCLNTARVLCKLGLEKHARPYFLRLIPPMMMMHDDDSGEKKTALSSVQKLAVYGWIESWQCDKDSSDDENKNNGLAKRLLLKFAHEQLDPTWLSLMMSCHTIATPYVAGTYPERNVQQLLIYGEGASTKTNHPMTIQIQQLCDLGRFPLPTPQWCKDRNAALQIASVSASANNNANAWTLIVSSSATFGPMFMRDWNALTELLPHISCSKKWQAVHLGYDLPALETVHAMCDTKPKQLLATFPSSTSAFALCITSQGAKNYFNNSSCPVSVSILTLAPPTVFRTLLD